ncbi:MAG TPA: glycosyltransferase [Gemmatimonadales bacterium]|nr:glycosyltransferase [Gemmatimonadales bacterium]
MDVIVVVPCYNEAERLPVETFASYLGAHPQVGLVLVNDGSRDNTLAVLSSLAARYPAQVSVLDLQPNGGKAEAVRRGLFSAMERKPAIVGFWDADLATPLDAIDLFEKLLGGRPDIEWVIGARVKLLGRHIERQELRHYLGRVFATAASLVLGIAVYDTQCGAKLFRVNAALTDSLQRRFGSRWIFDVELIGRFIQRLRAAGVEHPENRIYEYPLLKWIDVRGSKVKPTDFFQAFAELVGIWFRLRRDRRELRGRQVAGVPDSS